MARFSGIAAATLSVERLLNAAFADEQPVPGRTTRAHVVRTEELIKVNNAMQFSTPALTLFVYRVDFNKTMRAAWSAVGSIDGRAHLPLDVHILATPWADNAEYEQRILGKAMECLESTPILAGPLLYPDANVEWAANEAVQVVLEEISTEAVMRTFDSLPTDYKLSVPYLLRVVRLDAKRAHPPPTVDSVIRGMKPGVRE